MDQQIDWPVKTREMQNCQLDSTYWNDFEFRDDDIVIATWAKAGTTWVQQIVAQLVFGGDTEGMSIADMSPWLDFRLPPLGQKLPGIEAQTHRRFLKTHLPLDALVFSPRAKYIYIARDGRDCVWSMYNHHVHLIPELYDALNALPDMGPVIEPPRTNDLRDYFLDWFNDDGFPFWPFWENIRGWWAIRHLPNVHCLHFQHLKDDLPGEVKKIAKFLDIPVDAKKWGQIVDHCGFDYMKKNAALNTPLGGVFFDQGPQVFINRGTNNRWREVLTPEDVAAYDARAIEELGPACAHWLATGEDP